MNRFINVRRHLLTACSSICYQKVTYRPISFIATNKRSNRSNCWKQPLPLQWMVTRHLAMSKTNSNYNKLFEQLCLIAGKDNVNQSDQIRRQHGRDEGHFETCPADIVVWPQTTEQVSQVAKLCYENDVPITPFGTGTGLEGGVNAMFGGVCIALTKMDKVVEVNAEDFDCTVEAGVTWRDLNQHLNGTGLFFPIDPGASASLGGMASTGASGTNAVYYGTMKENVINLEVVLPDGKIIKTGGINGRARKSSAGFNLTELFIGSEGTLGMITKVTLRLYPIPETLCACKCHFEDNKTTIDTVIELLQNNMPLSRIEYVDKESIMAGNHYSKMDWPVKPALFMEISGNQADIDQIAQSVKDIVVENGGSGFEYSTKNEDRSKLWKARHDLYYACRNTRPGHQVFTTDVAVPISRLTDVILRMNELTEEYDLNAFLLGHVGDGNFHSLIVYDENDPEQKKRTHEVAHKLAEFAISLGGTCTGEHGVGRGKLDLVRMEFDSASIDVMRRIKQTLDPKGLLNAGKVIPPL